MNNWTIEKAQTYKNKSVEIMRSSHNPDIIKNCKHNIKFYDLIIKDLKNN